MRAFLALIAIGCASGCSTSDASPFGDEEDSAAAPDDAGDLPPPDDDAGSVDTGSPGKLGKPDAAPIHDTGSKELDTGASMDAGSVDGSDLQHCVDVINPYRAKVGAPALTRSSALEAFAAEGALSDSKTGEAHGHFMATSGGDVAFAENEIPGWPLADYGSLRVVIDQGLQMMWDEGPGGGHHDNMASREYTQVGCGSHVTASGDVWVVQDFR